MPAPTWTSSVTVTEPTDGTKVPDATLQAAAKITSEAFIYSYARCYGLRYLVFRFSNVYGRYDSDLWRMERVLPLWMHSLDPLDGLFRKMSFLCCCCCCSKYDVVAAEEDQPMTMRVRRVSAVDDDDEN